MSNKRERILTVERPDAKGVIDFLSDGVTVEAEVSDGKVRVVVKVFHGGGSSSWDLHEIEYDIPEREEEGGDPG